MGGRQARNGGELKSAGAIHRHESQGSASASRRFQSRVRDDGRRSLLLDLDRGIRRLGRSLADPPEARPASLQRTGVYHNLLRQWAEL